MHPGHRERATILGSLGKSDGGTYHTVPSGVKNIEKLIAVFQIPKTLIFKLVTTQVHPNNGMFISNCPHHVSHNNPAVWGNLQAILTELFYTVYCSRAEAVSIFGLYLNILVLATIQ